MSKLTAAVAAQFRRLLVLFAVCLVGLAGVGLWALSESTSAANSLYSDKLNFSAGTGEASDRVRDAYEQAIAVVNIRDGARRQMLADELYNTIVPAADISVDRLQHLRSVDTASERTLVTAFAKGWRDLRAVFAPNRLSGSSASTIARLQERYRPVEELADRLRGDVQQDAAEAAARVHRIWSASVVFLACAGVAVGMAVGIVLRGVRRVVNGVMDSHTAQQQFLHAMQLATNEEEANAIIKRHIERVVPTSAAVVLNRNNSSDRLEAMTVLPQDWPLAERLENAEPRSCAAIRDAQPYRRVLGHDPIIQCRVCGDCPRGSLCTPITVGGEVIGAVLIERSRELDNDDEQKTRESVSQAAPTVANLRNLAIAELRAATDALTGLPNKRAVQHTLKRMVAQTSRTLGTLAALSIDLDHFKEINDQLGHPRGDEVLAAVGAALQAGLRDSDFAGRNGGEEFLVLCPATDRAGALVIAEKLKSSIADLYVHSIGRRITASIGVAVIPDDAGDAEQLERAADGALYLAKANGRNRIETAPAQGSAHEPSVTTARGTSLRSTPDVI
jgi:diguanylate cyclase (GGDEF)-like protein